MKDLINFLSKKDQNGEYARLWTAFAFIFFFSIFYFWFIPSNKERVASKNEAQTTSVQLEAKYEYINNLIIDGDLDKAKSELVTLIHPSNEVSDYKPDGILSSNYTYNEYWALKREELRNKIESKLSK